MRKVSLALVLVLVFVVASCGGVKVYEEGESPVPRGPIADPWADVEPQVYEGDGFTVLFPTEWEESTETEQGRGFELVRTDIDATVGDDYSFSLSWSEAPLGTNVQYPEMLLDNTAQRDADNNEAEIVEESSPTILGREAVEFLASQGGNNFYWDVRFLVGGRLYELTVTQLNDDKEAFDTFIESFALTSLPIADDAEWFAELERQCAALGASGVVADTDSDAEVVARYDAAIVFYEQLNDLMLDVPVTDDEQGDATAYLTFVGRTLQMLPIAAAAIRSGENAERYVVPDLNLLPDVAATNGAPTCAL